MSHTMGVRCRRCRELLLDGDPCPEKGCPGGHGETFTDNHDCPKEVTGR
ncbi:MAG: hypothetical protein JWP31_1820 [Aeromicrobium sp.]|nr:hypothetical protein [Aeromicrobium sp.]